MMVEQILIVFLIFKSLSWFVEFCIFMSKILKMTMKQVTMVDLILKERAFLFTESTLITPDDFEVEHYLSRGNEKIYSIILSESNLRQIISGLKEYFGIFNIDSWESAMDFLNQIMSYFEHKIQRYNNHVFIKENLSRLIFDEVKNDAPFESLITNLQSTTFDTPYFHGFLEIAFKKKFPPEVIYEQLQRLDEQKNYFFVAIIIDSVKHNVNKAEDVASIYFKDDSCTFFENFRAILCGIVQSKNKDFFETLIKFGIKIQFQPSIINALAMLNTNDESTIMKAYEIINSFPENEANNLQKLGFFSRISKLENCPKEVLDIFQEDIKLLTQSKSSNIQYCLLENLNSTHITQDKKLEILGLLVQNKSFDQGFLVPNGSNIYQLDWSLKLCITEPQFYMQFLIQFCMYQSFKTEYFPYTLPNMTQNNPDMFLSFCVECLIDYEGNKRLLGFELLSYIAEHSNDIKFSTQIFQLSEERQIILFLSIYIPSLLNFTQLFRLILPLINAESEVVRQLIIFGLVEKFPTYPNLLSDIEKALNGHNEKENILTFFRQEENRYQSIKAKKIALKEFNPFYTQHSIFELYQKFFQEQTRKSFEKAEEQSIFGRLGAKKTILLKGGGYKIQGHEDIRHLQNFHSSFTIPEGALVDSNNDYLKRIIYFSESWTDVNDWKKWLIRL